MRRVARSLVLALLLALILLSVCGGAFAQTGVTTQMGSLPDGAAYLIEVPANWNGTLFLYSHGYVVPGSSNPALDVGDPITRLFMLGSGFALAGSSYATTGWAIHEALLDQIAVLDVFNTLVGKPKQTIAWGHSLGGIITAGLIQRNPSRFDAALPMCGVLSGGVATWNTALDSEFAFKTLLAPGTGLQLVNITDPVANLTLAEGIGAAAQATAQGRARLALSAALGNTPGWFTPLSPEPAAEDFADQELNQYMWGSQVDYPFVFAFRAELEARAGGNVSSNTNVDYDAQLNKSIDAVEVRALYQQAGLDLDADLETLNNAPRFSADPDALHYLEQNIIFNGETDIPVLTLHTKGDGLVVLQNEDAYRAVVDYGDDTPFLRRAVVSRAGHCAFTPAETITAVLTLLQRLDTGTWPAIKADSLNAAATALGSNVNIFAVGSSIVPVSPAFIDFLPSNYLRTFDANSQACKADTECQALFPRSDPD